MWDLKLNKTVQGWARDLPARHTLCVDSLENLNPDPGQRKGIESIFLFVIFEH